jgi:hypothetical protein
VVAREDAREAIAAPLPPARVALHVAEPQERECGSSGELRLSLLE